eukprot:Filipodium_phascolosomae@DN730_c0_g1_i1.p1
MKELIEKARGRQAFTYQGRTIYEWDQTLDEVHVYLSPPEGTTKQHFNITIEPRKLTVGLHGNPPFIDEKTFSVVDVKDSFWMLEDDELHIQLQKMKKGETWTSVLVGHGTVDSFVKDEIQKKLLLERFEEEHPGFDFSGAQFSGSAKDPRDFCGGVKYT